MNANFMCKIVDSLVQAYFSTFFYRPTCQDTKIKIEFSETFIEFSWKNLEVSKTNPSFSKKILEFKKELEFIEESLFLSYTFRFLFRLEFSEKIEKTRLA